MSIAVFPNRSKRKMGCGWSVVCSLQMGGPAMVFWLVEEAGFSFEELQSYSTRCPGCQQFGAGSHYDFTKLLSLLPN